MASFVDRLIDSGGFSQLVFRVKEHLRRGDNSIGPDEEEAFQRIVSFCLRYYRLKVEHETKTAALNAASPWVPKLQVIMQALDRMSFHRAALGIKTLTETKKYDKVVGVMNVYHEMLCMVLLLLSSSDTCHHELAAAALFSLFFRSSDRLDPLPQLLRDWRPSLYNRQHVDLLLELLHHTMKLLEKAKAVFSSSSFSSIQAKSKRKKQDSVSDNYDVALEQYVASVFTYDVNEYFKRFLVTNQTIRMYTRMLEKFETNSLPVNHYIYVFFQRMLQFKLDDDGINQDDFSAAVVSEHSLTLGHLLFNVQTLTVFNNVLQNDGFNRQNPHLLDLIRSVVRRFAYAAEKNHLIFVESLLQHPHAVDFLKNIDSVYEAASYGRPFTGYQSHEAKSDNIDKEAEHTDEAVFEENKARTQLGDEFEEGDLSAAFNVAAKPITGKKRDRGRGDKEAVASKGVKKHKKTWSTVEDSVLRAQYKIYRGSRSIFETIALCPELRYRPHNSNCP